MVSFKNEEEIKKWLKGNKSNLFITGEEYRSNQPLKDFF